MCLHLHHIVQSEKQGYVIVGVAGLMNRHKKQIWEYRKANSDLIDKDKICCMQGQNQGQYSFPMTCCHEKLTSVLAGYHAHSLPPCCG